MIDGDEDAYSIGVHAPLGARYETNSRTSGTVHFDQCRNNDSVIFRVQARRDIDIEDDALEIAIDKANLPDGYYLGDNTSWRLAIVDNSRIVR